MNEKDPTIYRLQKEEVGHIDLDPTNNRLDNLELVCTMVNCKGAQLVETWRPYPGQAFIWFSDRGRAYTVEDGTRTYIEPDTDPNGYQIVPLYELVLYVHLGVARAYLGAEQTDLVTHKDGDKTNNAVHNLAVSKGPLNRTD